MAVTIKDLFLHFKYYSCCQGDKDTIVLEFSKDGKKGLEDRVPKVINTHTHIHASSVDSIEHAVHFSRACSVTRT